jgi:predicted short-subunit dehydrogenase-like oxidoreductase (DUF2520 family)
VLGVALAGAGYRVVAVASRTFASAQAVANAVALAGAKGCVAKEPQAVADEADVVLVTMGDDAIRVVVEALRWRQGQGVVHCSGALTVEPLSAAAGQGAWTGSWHPFQTLTGSATLEGVTFGIEATGESYETLGAMASAVGGTPLAVPAEARPLYHAASVMSSGYLTTLLHEAGRLLAEAGMAPDAARGAIGVIARATLANVTERGAAASLTGPTSRGDDRTVRLHLEAVKEAAPELLPLYTAISKRSAVLAGETGRGGDVDWDFLFAPYRDWGHDQVREQDREQGPVMSEGI